MNAVSFGVVLRCVWLISLLSMSACSSKLHVHIFNDNLSETDLTLIEDKFKSSKILYSISTVKVPESISSNSILYTPSISSNAQIYKVIELLESSGFDISWTSILKVDNHSFTHNHMGLYLFSDKLHKKQEIKPFIEVNEYGSVKCGSYLRLNTDAKFTINFDIWDVALDDYREVKVAGTWHSDDIDKITLSANSWRTSLSFKKRVSIEPTPDGVLKEISLLPITENENIGFYLTASESQPNANCVYRTSIYQ
ncbi:hypothetical protein [Thalassotalea sp. G2M2-11]|uniref:hypothetical protein n=1 Tax=Thalassotalea sp. G2M2-11 TaxID=2787627 RepID=UPI0019D1F69A|nr:hypothetical protein [Thalassotalea sp. G2M2-11]